MDVATTLSTPLARAKSIYDDIAQAGDAIDRERELPEQLANKLKLNGFFRLLVPKSMGGEEMEWPDYLDVIRTIAHADGSVGWCVNQGAVFATNSSRSPRELAEEIWGDPNGVVGNGPPIGPKSVPVDGGYQLSGQWIFSSGCRHANWLAALATPDGETASLHFLPRNEIDLIDVWQVSGLRGTGSFSFAAENHFVPKSRVMPMNKPPIEEGPIYVIPQSLLFACGFGCVALGVARAALDCVIDLSRQKKPQFSRQTLAQDPVVQSKIGRAEALWRAAKALVYTTVEEIWSNVKASRSITMDERLRLRLAGTHAIRQSADVVDIVYNLSGSTAIFEYTPIQRKFQDIHVITQQVQGREAHYQTVGSYLLGEEPSGGIF